MACNPLIQDPFEFPRRVANRPGLSRIDYRIGRYPEFVEAMTRAIDAALPLASWTHRTADDPGIALLEGAAILGDILTFYQQHYANEAYLRTAAWRESVSELVRLTGYRLAPGIGGRATLAFEARGTAPITLRQGFPVKADLATGTAPAEFQTDAELVVWPHLGRFNLFRARHYAVFIAGGQTQFEIASVGGATDSIALDALELKKGDRLLLVPEENVVALIIQFLLGWTFDQPLEEIVVVDKIEHTHGRAIVTVAGKLTHGWLANCRAYLLGRSFRHFGANAPPQLVQTNTATNPPTTTAVATVFGRDLRNVTNVGSPYAVLDPHVFLLDQEVGDLPAGKTVVATGIATNGVSYVLPFAQSREIRSVRGAVPQWGNLTGASTVVQVKDVLAPAWTAGFGAFADIRLLRLHETKGPELTLRPLPAFESGAFANGTNALRFYGSASEAQALAGRSLYLSHQDGRSAEVVCTNQVTDFPSGASQAPQMWPISFNRAPLPFVKQDFDEAHPTVTVFGNLVDASQGKQEQEAVLGNGDNRERFQTFPLPKPHLTYFLASDAFPPHTPELEIYVNGRLWSRVDAFFGHAPDEEIYIVREDASDLSFVQFGDGETGSRLPSGVKNVTARYRTGVGARGPIKPGATPSSGERPQGFDKVSLAGIVSGGADREPADKAREAAPGKVQSLGRLVSLQDYETETLSIPGVTTASAAWALHVGVPAVILRVLLDAGREAEFADVRASIAHAQRCHGPDRFPVIVEQALLRYAFLDIVYSRDPRLKREDVEAAIRGALGLVGDSDHERDGLFGLRARRLGEIEYATRIEGRVQNVPGVVWCRVSAMGLFSGGVVDPTTLILPAAPRSLTPTLPCSAHELLQVTSGHLTLTAAAEPAAGECA
jgi:hypothetical protein